jgi:hypothetical protein
MEIKQIRPHAGPAVTTAAAGEDGRLDLERIRFSRSRDDDRIDLVSRSRYGHRSRGGAGNEPLSEERIVHYRERIRSGHYDTAEVTEDVARRILESGDL